MIGIASPDFCGCDEPELGSAKLISFDAALQKGLALAAAVSETESIKLANSIDRVLAEPAIARSPLPSFNNSAMDGYGIRTSDLIGQPPWTLPISARIVAGNTGDAEIEPATAVRIFTGAKVPDALDAVVMQEHVDYHDETITFDYMPEPGNNIRLMGEDLAEGETMLEAGRILRSRELGALAAIGSEKVNVRRRVRVAIFSTGTELREPGEGLKPGQIWNSNRFTLMADLSEPWIELIDLGTVPDDPNTLKEILIEATKRADIVVSTGGVSVGDEDHMPRLFREIGGQIQAMRVAMKPGKPVMLGTMDEAIYIGLPGNPVSCFVTWTLIGRKILQKRAGIVEGRTPKITVKSGFDLVRRPGRCEFRPARIMGYDATGAQIVDLMEPSFSARIAMLAKADGLALLPAEDSVIKKGHLLEFLPF